MAQNDVMLCLVHSCQSTAASFINNARNTFSLLHTHMETNQRISKVPGDTVQSGLDTYKYTYMEILKTISSPGGIVAHLDPES